MTKREALKICIELWSWLAETGYGSKTYWPKWLWNGGQYSFMTSNCSLCAYDAVRRETNNRERGECYYCPLKKELNYCGNKENDEKGIFILWNREKNITKKQEYASQIRDYAIEALEKL